MGMYKDVLRRIALTFLMIVLAQTVMATSKTGEANFEQVEGIGNWEHTIDVSELEPGKYNILVRARDVAGNEAIGRPYNVCVDRESDLHRGQIVVGCNGGYLEEATLYDE